MTGWIFEPHHGFGASDPDGDPWPFGYISEGPGKPLFELSPVIECDPAKLLATVALIAAAPDLLAAGEGAMPALYHWAAEKNIGRVEYDRRVKIVDALADAISRATGEA